MNSLVALLRKLRDADSLANLLCQFFARLPTSWHDAHDEHLRSLTPHVQRCWELLQQEGMQASRDKFLSGMVAALRACHMTAEASIAQQLLVSQSST